MLKKTYAFGLLAAATLGCFLTCCQQVKLRSISKPPRKMPQLLVMAIPFPDLDQGSYQNQLDYPGSGYYHPNATPQLQISNQDAKQNGAAVGTTPFSKTLTNNIQKQFGF